MAQPGRVAWQIFERRVFRCSLLNITLRNRHALTLIRYHRLKPTESRPASRSLLAECAWISTRASSMGWESDYAPICSGRNGRRPFSTSRRYRIVIVRCDGPCRRRDSSQIRLVSGLRLEALQGELRLRAQAATPRREVSRVGTIPPAARKIIPPRWLT